MSLQLVYLVCRLGHINRFTSGNVQTEGGINFLVMEKDFCLGPSWLNPIKALVGSNPCSDIHNDSDPTNENLIYAIIGLSCLLGILIVLPIAEQICLL